MSIKTLPRNLRHAAIGLAIAANALAATTDLATGPLVTTSSTSVLPNLMLMMDDSGSMDWDYMPDTGRYPYIIFDTNKYGYASSQCNGVYYDPNITYTPPLKADGTSYPNSSFTSAWMDGFKTNLGSINLSTTFSLGLYQSTSSSTAVNAGGGAAYYYKYVGSQTGASQKKYYDSSSTFYNECNTLAADGPSATLTLSGTQNTSVSSIKVGGVELMSGPTTSSTSASTVASYVASKISAIGYSATASGSKVTIVGPASAATQTPVITSTSNGMTITATSFAPFVKVTVSSTSGPGGTDERTNFANWFSYYRTRLNMMKSGTGQAFRSIDNHYRVGFATMNNNGGSKFLNPGTFDSTQKSAFYTMLYGVSANNSTPLLKALSRVGQLYAHKLPNNSLNGVAAADPVQYSCQQNFTILSTDGFWNDATNYDLNGNAVGNQDGGLPPPYGDGGRTVVTERTPTTTTTTTTTPRTVVDQSTRVDRTTTVSSRSRTDTYQKKNVSIGASCGGGKRWVTTKIYSGTTTETESTPTYSDQQYVIQTTTQYLDTAVTTTTSTRTVVKTDGVVTSDTTTVTTSGPTTSSTITSGPTTVTTASGSPATSTGAATSSYSPPIASIGWTQDSSSTVCIFSPGASTTYTLTAAGAWGATTTEAPTTTTGTVTHTSGYPRTTTGSPSTTTSDPVTGATTTTTSTTGGTSDTLADVAMYYYKTDLRNDSLGNCTGALGNGTNVCENNVPRSSYDTASWQHMTTFTLGLGAPGRMVFDPNYMTQTSGDYYSVKNAVPANPASGVCSWGAAGQNCTWPTPNSNGTPENIDDMWHAAVNGRGAYFSATNPSTLATGLANALAGVSARLGASAAATTSNPNVTSGDNFVFSSTFTTVNWDGQLVRQQLDLATGAVSATEDWKAQEKLDINTTRTIYTYDSAAANHLKSFDWSSLSASEKNYFSLSNISTLSQFCTTGATCLNSSAQAAAAGENLVNFLRGDRSNEGVDTDTSKYFRQRTHVLGDIVNAEAVYVKTSLYTYADAGYSAFITANKSRQGMVYAASNDGMLHAFDSETGVERWAYIPSFVLPNLYKLADKNYGNLHQYFVDGTPVVGDAYFGGSWHTILVGGLNGGGRGYYALDITDPAAPSLLWEFSHTNLGYSYGNPVITKLSNGTWVVLVASGYNNVSPGDGKGYLYVLNAQTGAIIGSPISTDIGDSSSPSGLARIAAWVNNPMVDNTAQRVYGGDLLGNLWRFDLNTGTKQLIATLKDDSNKAQPITVKPELGEVGGNAIIYVGTGRYLGTTDLADQGQQSFYAIKDNLGNTSYGSPRSAAGFIKQTQTTTTCPSNTPPGICSPGEMVRTSTNNTVNFATDNGWYIDLPNAGERDNTDPTLALGTIGFTSNVPDNSACNTGGYSFRYFLDYRTGGPVSTAGSVVAVKLGNAIGTRPVFVRLPTNTVVELTRLSDGTTVTSNVPIGGAGTNTRRVSWREIAIDK